MGAALAGQPEVALEFSLRLQPGRVATTGRFGCWLAQAGGTFAPVAHLLALLGAPLAVREAQQSAELSVRQGVSVSFTAAGPEFRLYVHGRRPRTLADCYRAWRWRPGQAPQRATYAFHFLPETPTGQRPLALVPALLRPAFAELLADEHLQQLSGFWLRHSEAGALEQLDVALPWHPAADALPGLARLASLLGLSAAQAASWRGLPIRHVACTLGAAVPTATLYASGPASAAWPRTEADLQAQVRAAAGALGQAASEHLLPHLRPPAAPPLVEDSPPLGTFYDGEAAQWQAVLGPALHYHAGLFDFPDPTPDDATMQAAVHRAVTALYAYIPAGGRLYDIGCGWGGPLALWARELGCPSLGVTISRAQYRYVAAQGLPVRWADAERTLPPGYFDCAVLLESFSHIRDKAGLLRALRPFVGRLVMRVNCQDSAPASLAFGGTMHMISTPALRRLLEDAGWRIRHWQDRRPEAWPTVPGWHRRLQALPPTADAHLETFRAWCARVAQAPQAWARHNPLLEVVAD